MSGPALSLPPLFSGHEVAPPAQPFDVACQLARDGCDSGLVVHARGLDRLRAAMVFAPEVPLHAAVAMLPACGLGFHDAFGALAPPETALTLTWDGAILLNGARCGALTLASDTTDPGKVPQWLVLGMDLALMSFSNAPGETPDVTALNEEGCGDIDPDELLEAWVRHSLIWINQWDEQGPHGLHAQWEETLSGVKDTVTLTGRAGVQTGVLQGFDADFGALLRGEAVALVPLSDLVNRSVT